MRDTGTSYYLTTALQALQAAYRANQDLAVATHLSQAMDTLHRMTYQTAKNGRINYQAANDPYEMDEFNSAV